MRPLTEDETKTFFAKLAKFLGSNIKFLIDNIGIPHCIIEFRHIRNAQQLKDRFFRCIGHCGFAVLKSTRSRRRGVLSCSYPRPALFPPETSTIPEASDITIASRPRDNEAFAFR